MNSTETTPAPAVGGRQVGQVLAGRYRLAMSKGGDDLADVWHALDASTSTVVTLEILRDRDNEAARKRFLAEAQRMAAIERPSVMRVAAIHDDAAGTFIVFEHLIPLPVVLTGLTAVATDGRPATKAADARTVVLTAAVPPSAQASEADAATPPTTVEPDRPEPSAPPAATSPRRPETVQAVSRSLLSARTDVSRVIARATRFAAEVRPLFRDARPDTLVVAARALVPRRVNRALVASTVARGSALVRRLATVRSSAELSAVAGPLIARARGNRALLAGAAVIVLAILVVASPLDDAIANARRSAPAPSPTAAPPPALAPAPFELPPLSAYGAAFESQGPYPTTSPGGTVEWVVALRNTGSVGWYRGIAGAQAALALPDGTGVAVQSTPYVAPGQVGWFVVRFRARAELGTYNVPLLPRIDGRGPLAELGIFAVVTVSKNP